MSIRPAAEPDASFVRNLLESANLPVDILDERKGALWVFGDPTGTIGCGAFEFYGEDALLRSVAIVDRMRNKGVGARLVRELESEARSRGVHTVWLLTETAETFFRKLGYEAVDRNVVVNGRLLESTEFGQLCASTAVCMRKRLHQEQ